MKKPYLLPSGNSCDEISLKAYFTSNGYKDPITRQDVNPNFIPANSNLENYIRNNPKLKDWEKYES